MSQGGGQRIPEEGSTRRWHHQDGPRLVCMFCQGTEVCVGTQALTVSPPSERRHELQVVTSARARVPTIRSSLLIQCPVLHEPTRGDWQRFSTLPPLCSSGSSSFFFSFCCWSDSESLFANRRRQKQEFQPDSTELLPSTFSLFR